MTNLLMQTVAKPLNAECTLATTLSDGLERLYSGTLFAGAVFDMLLPVGRLPAVVRSGDALRSVLSMQAGVVLASAFQEQFPGKPTVIWTSLSEEPVALQEQIDHGALLCLRKPVGTQGFAQIAEFLGSSTGTPSGLRSLWDALLLEPSFAGIGVDLKKIVDSFRKRS